MPVCVIHEQPEMFRPEMYDAVNEKLGTETDPPAGMISHTLCSDEAGKWLIVDIWESREAHDRFSEERLRPAVEESMRASGIDPGGAPAPAVRFYETHSVVVPGPMSAVH